LGEIGMAEKYYEDWVKGDEFVTPARTMTETDLVIFAGLTGDYNELHTNETFMKESQFGKRIGHGLLGLAVSHGLLFRTGFLEGTVLAFLDVESWKFMAPFFIGDTLRVKFRVHEAKASKSKPDRGIVKLYLELMNQDDKLIQSGYKTLMIKRKPSDP
jgi:acyl dehydratase